MGIEALLSTQIVDTTAVGRFERLSERIGIRIEAE
jgi:hypothetical protein